MKLYHGTSARFAAAIRKEGIRPRGRRKGNWPGAASGPDLVYLTECYAPYFAASATQDKGAWLILEIDTERLNTDGLMPDEDWLEQTSRKQTDVGPPQGTDIKGRTKWFRDRVLRFQHHWEDSLRGLGNCAYLGPVPAYAITRAAYFDPASNPAVAGWSLDPCIAIINRILCGDKYKALTRWFFEEGVQPAEVMMMGKHEPQRVEATAKALANRGGLRIETWQPADTINAT